MEFQIECTDHGSEMWQGDICCSNCDRVYQTTQPTAPFYAPEICACGKRLMPDDLLLQLQIHEQEFTAAPICHACFLTGSLKQNINPN